MQGCDLGVYVPFQLFNGQIDEWDDCKMTVISQLTKTRHSSKFVEKLSCVLKWSRLRLKTRQAPISQLVSDKRIKLWV